MICSRRFESSVARTMPIAATYWSATPYNSDAAACAFGSASAAPRYTMDDVVRLAQAQNPEIAIARQKIQAARGGEIVAVDGTSTKFTTCRTPSTLATNA